MTEQLSVQERVITAVADLMGRLEEDVTRNTHYQNDLNMDSLDAVELVMELEEEFDLEISDEDADSLSTVGETIDYIVKLKEKG